MKRSVLTVPQLGVNDDRAHVVSWTIADGMTCSTGQIVCELETTKAIQEVEANASGYIVPVVFAGEEVMVSRPLALIGDNLNQLRAERDSLRSQAETVSFGMSGAVAVTAKARRVAAELNVDVETLSAEMALGIVRESDVRAAYRKRLAATVEFPTHFPIRENRLPIAIYGAGAGGMTLKEAVDLGKEYDVVCFLDDAPDRLASYCGLPVFHGTQLSQLYSAGVKGVATEIASGNTRLRIRDQLKEFGLSAVTVIHPRAFVAPSAAIGDGCFIKAGAIIETNSSIGDMCIVDNGVVVAHDSNILSAVHLAPGVSTGGGVRVGSRTIIGIGSSIATGISIGENCIVSVGTAVTRDVSDNSVVEGVPGKVIGERKR